MDSKHSKALFSQWQKTFNSQDLLALQKTIDQLAPEVEIHMCHPFGDLSGSENLYNQIFAPLFTALPDVDRRESIVLSGNTDEGGHWLATMGNYMGLFHAPFLGIPPTGHLVHMRFVEFYRFENNAIVEMQAIWDIPELMMQAGVWPMAPQLGTFLCTPSPMKNDGLSHQGDGNAAKQHVSDMLRDLCSHPANPDPKVMQLDKYWHPKMNWYGPCGIGTARGIASFRHWHQIPFLNAMPNRKLDEKAGLMSHWIAEGNYVAETGWPNMALTLSDDGWMGIAPAGKEIFLKSLDFWNVYEENGQLLIHENWVSVDILDVYRQIGVDVFARMQEFTKVRPPNTIHLEQDF